MLIFNIIEGCVIKIVNQSFINFIMLILFNNIIVLVIFYSITLFSY